MSKTSEAIQSAMLGYLSTHSAYISQVDQWRVVVRADGTGNRRQRAAKISALKRAIVKDHGCTLVYDHTNYSEAAGFISRTEVWYRLSDPDATWEAREFSNAPEYRSRNGLVCITVYATEQEAMAHKPHGDRWLQVVEVRN